MGLLLINSIAWKSVHPTTGGRQIEVDNNEGASSEENTIET